MMMFINTLVIIFVPYVWSDSTAWIENFMTDKQPFISEEAETKRQESVQKARQQKANQPY